MLSYSIQLLLKQGEKLTLKFPNSGKTSPYDPVFFDRVRGTFYTTIHGKVK